MPDPEWMPDAQRASEPGWTPVGQGTSDGQGTSGGQGTSDGQRMPEAGAGAQSWVGFGRGVLRRLVVVGVCVAVSLAMVVAVQRPDRPGGSAQGSMSQADGGTVRSSSRTQTLAQSKSVEEKGESESEGSIASGNQVPARPEAAIGGLLEARATAIRHGDRAAWLATVAPASDARVTRFRAAQGRVFDQVRSLRPASWAYQVAGGYPVAPDRRAELGGVAWLAEVHLDYQLTPGGPTVGRQQFLTIVRRAGAWLIADDTDGATSRDIWDLGPIAHAVSARCLVIGASARRAQVEQFAAECGRSAEVVDRAWGQSWPRRTVLTVPGNLAQLGFLLGRSGAGSGIGADAQSDSGADAGSGTGGDAGSSGGSVDTAGLEKTAAVTIGPAEGPSDTVLINGAAFDELSDVGRRVVLTHELVHVATRATGSRSAPTWLAEGYADDIAYAGTGLSPKQVAGAALEAVEAGAMPSALPAPDDFNAAGDQAAAAYGLAWVAAGLIADQAGDTQRMQAFYQQAAAPDAGPAQLDAALAKIGLGGTSSFIKIWQARLRQLTS